MSFHGQKAPVFIIGAARSGTNMLRDIITSMDGYCTWDCDEINPILKHGNLHHPNDMFSKDMATPQVCNYLHKEFGKLRKKNQGARIIEKTCANTLRIPFLSEVFPSAKYIFIYRSGMDASSSAMKRWKAPFNLQYTLKKARYIPVSDLPYYALKFGSLRIKQLFGERKLSFWGVKIPNLQQLSQSFSLPEICAWQWRVCNEEALNSLAIIEDSNKCFVKYEDFVKSPTEELMNICHFLDAQVSGVNSLVRHVSYKSIGKYKSDLAENELQAVSRIVRDVKLPF